MFGSVTSDTAEMQDENTGGEEDSEKGVEREARQESAPSHLRRSVLINYAPPHAFDVVYSV